MMERGVQVGRWNRKAPVGTILLLVCMFIPVVTSFKLPEEQKCPDGDYRTDEGICCNKCSPGFKLAEKCHADGHRSKCTSCPPGEYTAQLNYAFTCKGCRRCKKQKHEIEVSSCEKHRNTICRCEEGYYKFNIDSQTSDCLECSQCRADEKEKQTCTPETDTVCECKENYYKVNKKCEPCKNCSAECHHHCSLLTLNTKDPHEAPGNGGDNPINIIAVLSVALVLVLVLGVLITHFMTKRCQSSERSEDSSISQPSNDSSDSCNELLVSNSEGSTIVCVKAVPHCPVGVQELSNLPDCVPLESKSKVRGAVPELIYSVLDVVPVLQVKQLVRSLGVRDSEIEQAELDHRPCREAHYQMLRVWAETDRPRTGGGGGGGGRGRGGEPPLWPLLQELLDELRNMHLGWAAEELETKYGIQ